MVEKPETIVAIAILPAIIVKPMDSDFASIIFFLSSFISIYSCFNFCAFFIDERNFWLFTEKQAAAKKELIWTP